MERDIKNSLKQNNYKKDFKALIDEINQKERFKKKYPLDYFDNLLKQDLDAVDFVHRISEQGFPEFFEIEAKSSWPILSKYKDIWQEGINKTNTLIELCSLTKNFLVSLYNKICMDVQDVLECLNSNTKSYSGILITGNNVSKVLYKKLRSLYFLSSHMPVLAESYPESLVNAWAGLEMVRAGYKGRSGKIEGLILLESMPIGSPKRLPIKKITARHTKDTIHPI